MKSVHVFELLRKTKADSGKSRIAARFLTALAILAVLVAPMLMRTRTVEASCRFTSTLRILPDILSDIVFQQQGDKQWAFGFILNTNRHVQFCLGNPVQPSCNFDGFTYKPLLGTSNVCAVFGSGDCAKGWVIQTCDSNDFTVGWKCEFEQDYVSTGVLNQASKTFQVPVHPPNFVHRSNLQRGRRRFLGARGGGQPGLSAGCTDELTGLRRGLLKSKPQTAAPALG